MEAERLCIEEGGDKPHWEDGIPFRRLEQDVIGLENTTRDQPPAGFNSIHHHSLRSVIQLVLYPVKSTPIQTMGS